MAEPEVSPELTTTLPLPDKPEPPRAFIDTTYAPLSGPIVRVHEAAQLQSAIDNAKFGTTIVLDSGQTYVGNWQVKPKSWQQGWIHIISSKFLLQSNTQPSHPAGKRITPADAADMAHLVSATQQPVFMLEPKPNAPAVSHIRFIGLEIFTRSNFGADSSHSPWPINGQTPVLVSLRGTDSITIDRCYIHGALDKDVVHAVIAFQGASNVAVVDSEISEIHTGGLDSQAFCVTSSLGPFKLLNNKLSATTEDVMFGGAGIKLPPPFNGYVPADIEIRGNYFWKDEEHWYDRTTGEHPQWTEKNNLEFKSAQRVLVVGNTFENAWQSGQVGSNLLIETNTTQSGANAVTNDILFDSNTCINANFAVSVKGKDPDGPAPGESRRVQISNNMFKLRSVASKGSYHPLGFSLGMGMWDYLIKANTIVSLDGRAPWASIYMNQNKPDLVPVNLWIVDNVIKNPLTGIGGLTGQKALDTYMPEPPPPAARYTGNLIQ